MKRFLKAITFYFILESVARAFIQALPKAKDEAEGSTRFFHTLVPHEDVGEITYLGLPDSNGVAGTIQTGPHNDLMVFSCEEADVIHDEDGEVTIRTDKGIGAEVDLTYEGCLWKVENIVTGSAEERTAKRRIETAPHILSQIEDSEIRIKAFALLLAMQEEEMDFTIRPMEPYQGTEGKCVGVEFVVEEGTPNEKAAIFLTANKDTIYEEGVLAFRKKRTDEHYGECRKLYYTPANKVVKDAAEFFGMPGTLPHLTDRIVRQKVRYMDL